MKSAFQYLLLPALLLLSACAPTTAGEGVGRPLALQAGEQIEAERGDEVFLQYDYSLEDLGLNKQSLSGAFWIPAGVNRESANIAPRFSLQGVRAPARWELELAEVRAFRTSETEHGRQTATVSYRAKPVLKLGVPANAELGVTTVRAELSVRGGNRIELELPVRVRAAAVK